MNHLISDIGIAITISTVVGFIAYKLKQPSILGFLIAGVIIGPEIGPKLITDPENINTISEIGLIFLLFIIGLEMNPAAFLESARKILVAGSLQFPLTILLSIPLFMIMGYSLQNDFFSILYLGAGLSLSSTAIIVKLLYDKFEVEGLAGKATIGILIFQDIWAILFLAVQPNLKDPGIMVILGAVLKAVFLVIWGVLVSRYILKRVFQSIRSPEMTFTVAIGWCIANAGLGHFIGLSSEMGALIAGLVLSTHPFSVDISSRVLPLRDFFLTLFFISLGMKIPMPEMGILKSSMIIILFIPFIRILIIFPAMFFFGNSRRTSILTALNLSQISEFSLVIASIGYADGHISKDVFAVLLYTLAVSSVTGSYIIKFNHEIVGLVSKVFKKIKPYESTPPETESPRKIFILGYHRGIRGLVHSLYQTNPELLREISVIDFNAETKSELEVFGIRVFIGDISNSDNLRHAGIQSAKIIISTIPDAILKGTDNSRLVKLLRTLSPGAYIITHGDYVQQVKGLLEAGADDVILPYIIAGEHLADKISSIARKMEN